MFINKFFKYSIIALTLAGCSGTTTTHTWNTDYETGDVGLPTQVPYKSFANHGTSATDTHSIAVLLPLTGENAQIGKSIQKSIELATLEVRDSKLHTHFYDTAANADNAIATALASNPDIIIGPVFAGNARKLRDVKPDDIPAISFTSDVTAVGNGVMTMALMPHNSIESIIDEMSADKIHNFIIVAPNTMAGQLMSGAAVSAAKNHEMEISGIFHYTEGDSESIKQQMQDASMNTARTAANNKAREVLSDILTNESLNPVEKSSVSAQLEKLSKTEFLGEMPYNAVLFLGNGDDTKSLASFLRYYGLDAHKISFYGTAMWDGSDITSDFTMSGAKYAALPESDSEFLTTYTNLTGAAPTPIATLGYDATKIAIGMIYSHKNNATYLLNPSGFLGISGLVRMMPTGTNERALRIMKLNTTATPIQVKTAATNFLYPIYQLSLQDIEQVGPMELQTNGINPAKNISIPERLRSKYRTKTIGANTTTESAAPISMITFVPGANGDSVGTSNFVPLKRDSVRQTYIDSIEISEH